MSFELDRQGLVGIFVLEASEAMDVLDKAFHPSDGTAPSPAQLQAQYVWAHKVRGASALYGYEGLSLMGSLLESILEEAPSIDDSLWPKALEILRGMVVSFEAQLKVVADGGIEDHKVSAQWKGEVARLFPSPFAATSSEPGLFSPDYLVPALDAEVLSYFVPESDAYLQTMESLLHRLRENFKDGEAIYTLSRTAHTLKVAARTIGFKVISDMAHSIEDCIIAVREGQISPSSDELGVIGQAIEVMRLLMRRDDGMVAQLQHDVPEVTQRLAQIRNGEQMTVTAQAVPAIVPVVRAATVVMDPSAGSAGFEVAAAPVSNPLTDEYLLPPLDAEVLSYFAPEAQEYIESLEAQLLRLEKEEHNSEVIDQLFRTAHTLKGSAYTVGFQSLGDLTHYVEDFMMAVREGRVKILPGHTDVLLRSVDVVRLLMRRDPTSLDMLRQRYAVAMQGLKQLGAAQVVESGSAVHYIDAPMGQEPRNQEAIEPAKAVGDKTAEGKAAEDREVIRVSRDRLERLLNLVGELVIGRGRLEQRLHMLEQLSQQVLACKGRLVESVHSFAEKHTFTLPTTSSGPPTA
ncbi:MAG TPA: Hpt domain-containing protein [Nitrospiraceae bacterium]|nr:Hpt domain-containing protein [Nitrospiraceae bacterium]